MDIIHPRFFQNMARGGLYEASHMELEVCLIALVVGLVKLGSYNRISRGSCYVNAGFHWPLNSAANCQSNLSVLLIAMLAITAKTMILSGFGLCFVLVNIPSDVWASHNYYPASALNSIKI